MLRKPLQIGRMFGVNIAATNVQEELFDDDIMPAEYAVTALRDSGYKNTAYALAELIDNSQQAGASSIEVLCLQTRELVSQRERSRLSKIAVLDNGSGMDQATLYLALQFGRGSYLKDRSGIGRFGIGLPNASISQARRVDVWSWQNGPDNALRTYIDVEEIEAGTQKKVPAPTHQALPSEWLEMSDQISKSGTLVVWSKLDTHRLFWKTAKATLVNTERIVGRIYRRFILDESISIKLYAQEESGEVVYDEYAAFDDPLYLNASPLVPPPFNERPMFKLVLDDPHEITFNGSTHTVNVRYSIAKSETNDLVDSARKNRGQMPYGVHAARSIGVSLVRAGRELVLDAGWCIGYNPRERWWGAEVEFPPALDEVFGVTNNKQAATHFAELASMEWKQLAEEDEEFRDVVNRLKEEGDPRGYLLPLQDSIKRTLGEIRLAVEAQGRGRRPPRKPRHEPDDVTDAVNEGWNQRSRERPIPGEERQRTREDYEELKQDFTENLEYEESDAEALVELIREANLRVVFLEADFPNDSQLFNVEMKGGNLTEIIFNRRHPAFTDIFGTINTIDEDVDSLGQQEVFERLRQAINATKIIFAAWGRYEREAGVDRARALQKVRNAWGQIAAGFLDPEDESDL